MKASVSNNNDPKPPILRGFRVRGLVFVHCPWCDRMLVHGWGRADSARVIEVRCAHGGHQPPCTVRVSNKRVSTKGSENRELSPGEKERRIDPC